MVDHPVWTDPTYLLRPHRFELGGEVTIMAKQAGLSTILVIEDYPDSRTLLSSLLRAKGYKVVEAGDGREGLRQAYRATPDLILMDLAMPEMDGIEATRQLRQRHTLSHTPIFAISAYTTADVKQDAMAAGCAEVFAKPLDVESLLGRIKATLGA
jgi:CheY-like chemotaxis protein